MTKYTRQVTEKKEVIKPKFTHVLDGKGLVLTKHQLAQYWDNVKLLDGKREDLDQFLVWNDTSTNQYFIFLGNKGNVFDNI